ncbi:MAG: hypothetical protein COC24_011595 [Alphaproteobacteria bacterium]|nr:hypothetical protein [Alphaproteobacteria bacterium]
MEISGSGSLGPSGYIKRLNSDLSDLQVQLSTQKKAQTYGGLGNDRDTALRMRADINSYTGYNNAIKHANIHLSTVQNVLGSLGNIESNARSDFNGTAMSLSDGSFVNLKINAHQSLSDVINLLNEKMSDRYLFAGTKLGDKPIETLSNILNGQGNRAGLKQVISERKQADLGPMKSGRLAISAKGMQVNVAEDGVHDFGIKLSNVTHAISGLNVTQATGALSSVNFDFTGAKLISNDTITMRLTLPDGADFDIELKAKTHGIGNRNGFLIGATNAETTANFHKSLTEAFDFVVNGEMMAASDLVAANDFFSDNPKRVDGPPFDRATAMKAGTDLDTMAWYKGDKTIGTERSSHKVYASKHSAVEVNTRANEEPLRELVKNLSMMVAEKFDPASKASDAHYAALKMRITAGLSDDSTKTSVLDLSTELGYKQKYLADLSMRNNSRIAISEDILFAAEGVDVQDVSAKILALNTQLETSHRVTSMLSKSHLVNFL